MRKLLGALKNERGQGMVEYALILALVAVAAIVVLGLLGFNINTIFTSVSAALTGVAPGA